jgi:glycosyltransferase involved in cell wall biosynthesis
MRLAWFSPVPPVPTGIAACSADLLAALSADYEIDTYVDESAFAMASAHPPAGSMRIRSAHDFVWRHRQTPYDLTIFQLGNSSHHDYIWPYLFRYPGLTVLHDVHLHHARAAALLRTRRAADYRAEFSAAEPDTSADAAELAVAGFDSHLYYMWPMTRLVARASRMVAVHTPWTAVDLRERAPGAAIDTIRLGHGALVTPECAGAARARVAARHGIASDAVLFGCFGGLTPDKRIPQVLSAFAALLPYAPGARLLLVGAAARHYDVAADVAARGLQRSTVITGYVETDEALTEYIAACDVTLNLRWPTAREVSGPWLRCLAAGKPTVIVDLAHVDVPALDPRTWQEIGTASGEPRAAPVCVAIDIVDEDHSLRLALRRLALDAELRAALGRAAAGWWLREHAPERMFEDYRRVIPLAMARRAPRPDLPAHLVDDGDRTLRRLLQPFGAAVTARIPSL